MSSTPHGIHRLSSQGRFVSRHSLDPHTASTPNSGPVNSVDDSMDSEQNASLNSSTLNDKKSSFFDLWKMSCPDEIASKLKLMTQAPRICHEMRDDGIVRLLVQFIHQHSIDEQDSDLDLKSITDNYRQKISLRRNSSKALQNIINNTAKNKKEIQILSLLEDLRSFVEILFLKYSDLPADCCDHPCAQLTEVYQFVCDQESKKIIEMLGGVYVILDVIQTDHRFHQKECSNQHCIQLRQSSLNILTDMTCNNTGVKSLLGSTRSFMFMLVDLLKSSQDNGFVQSVANVFHNLTWKTDYSSKQIMRDCEAVKSLIETAMKVQDQATLNSLLEPLLNLTAHSTPNKHDFCRVENALEFLISTLVIDEHNASGDNSSRSGTLPTRAQLAIVENSGGILRNISSYLANQESLLAMLRAKDVCSILMDQLKSPSLVIVSNACITLSNLTLKSSQEQTKLIDLGAVNLLQKLTASKHNTIHVGASKTLKNLLPNLYPLQNEFNNKNNMKTSHSIPGSLHMRKMKRFTNDIASCLNENYDKLLTDNNNNSPVLSPTKSQTLNRPTSAKMQMNSMCNSFNGVSPAMNGNKFSKVQRSSSHDSIGSTHSEPVGKIFSNASSFVGESKSSAQAAVAFMNLANQIDPRMVNSYSGQTLNSIYATLPANSRIREQSATTPINGSESMMSDVTSDYDMTCSDISGIPRSMSTSIAGVQASNAFLETEPQDPEPTDYSQRFKEQLDDDFNSNRVVNKSDVNSGCEDTVKVYQTENTPLAFSLAPSLTDLREIGNETNEKPPAFQEPNNICIKSQENFQTMNNYFKKAPNLPPKPSKFSSSASAFCLKSINEEDPINGSIEANPRITPNRTPNYRKPISRDEMDYRYSQFGKDSQFAYATEDTPAIFSHATSLSSLSVDDEPDGEIPGMNESSIQTQKLPNNSWTVDDELENGEGSKTSLYQKDEEGDDDVFHEQKNQDPKSNSTPIATKRSSKVNNVEMPPKANYENVPNSERNTPKERPLPPTGGRKPLPPIPSEEFGDQQDEDDYDYLLTHCIRYALPKSNQSVDKKQTSNVKPKVMHNESSNSTPNKNDEKDDAILKNAIQFALPKPNSDGAEKKEPSNSVSSNEIDDEEDDVILSNAMQFALPKHDGSRKPATPKMFSGSGNVSVGKSPRVFKRNPNSTPNSHQMHAQHINNLGNQEQCRQFHVEDTPVHFSTIHSSLSSLIESDDEILDQQLLNAAIKFDQSRAQNRTHNGPTPNNESMSNTESESTLTGGSRSRPTRGHSNSVDQQHFSQQQSSSSSRSVSRQQRRQMRTNSCDNESAPADDEDDDERTYTVGTQSSRQNSAKSSTRTSRTPSSMDVLSSSNTLRNTPGLPSSSMMMVQSSHSNMTESGYEFDHIQPPALVNDRKAMQSSYDSDSMHRSTNIPINRSGSQQKSANNSHASPSLDSFIDRQQPPSIMDRLSIMSHSSASINDDIPEIDMDGVPIRGTPNSELVANAASNCAKELKQMVIAMTDSTKDLSLSDSVSVSRNDKTFDLEPGPNGTLSRTRSNMTSSKTPTTGTDTRTYTKNDKHTQNHTLTKGSTLRDKNAQLNLDDSDTDISENLPFDDSHKHRRDGSSVSSEMYSNPMSSKPGSMLSVSSKPPPPKPPVRKQSSIGSSSNRTESKCSAHSSSHVEPEDPYFSDPEVISPAQQFGYALSSRKHAPNNGNYFEQISASQQVFYPHHGNDPNNPNSYPEHHLQNFHSLGRNCGRNDRRVRTERDFEDKEFMFTSTQRMQMFEQQFAKQNNNAQNFGTLSKYCDPSLVESTNQMNNMNMLMAQSGNQHPTMPETHKGKHLSKGLFRKLTSSLSSHNIGERTPEKNYPPIPSKANVKDLSSKKSYEKINSRISSLWKRSKSSHEKLSNEAAAPLPNNNQQIMDAKAAELNRSIVARRSFAKKPYGSENDGQYFMNGPRGSVPHSPSIDNATFSTFGRNNQQHFDPSHPAARNNIHTGTRSYKKPAKPSPPNKKASSVQAPTSSKGNNTETASHNESQATGRKTCLVTTV